MEEGRHSFAHKQHSATVSSFALQPTYKELGQLSLERRTTRMGLVFSRGRAHFARLRNTAVEIGIALARIKWFSASRGQTSVSCARDNDESTFKNHFK